FTGGAQSDNSDAFEGLSTDPPNYVANVKIYPNPGKDVFTLETEGEHQVVVLDLNGQQIIDFSGNNISTFDLSGFADGLYILKVQANNKISIIKLIKE